MQRTVIVCCIESGKLELQTIRLTESIRRNGGSISNLKIIAVRPRRGPSISLSSRKILQDLQVDVLEEITNREFAWQHYTNKPLALLAAERVAPADQYIWLDSDMLVLDDPSEFWLGHNEDFAACASDKGGIGSAGPHDLKDGIWQRSTELLGLSISDLPWVVTCIEGERIRFYINAGVFSYRGGLGFADAYYGNCISFLRNRIGQTHQEVHFMDQIALGLAVQKLQLRWRLLTYSHNYVLHSKLLHWFEQSEANRAKVWHYHDMMEVSNWNTFCELVRKTNNPISAYLAALGPIEENGSVNTIVRKELLRVVRGMRRRLYYASCGFLR